ncbi:MULTISPECIES: sensor histidine kinase [unclassified Streptomyces]|uniref:sensor histidine kinase n=1 Tax=unclassified Streptomyces TaxID=2593676 RepID=UPI002253C8BB|nr:MULTISPECIES: sensor histidine kinase [unclassified Streptomyces]WSP56848.1 sensor domain-containing protein [Streptomyces sp. NBC_01241]WSU22435.1 sensor domain-containing protein [Streptomyces sp. NBC_01108]MCX4795625.1 sensor domain-containing protein [Streptomyces sp. NBC_01242]WSJ36925.1 sensor domain-containing protein [Streptomyces sp. NBC_01321]WSP63325.1 sensor domain-containing protein [Streptomyces sp. NBC_01240]
MATAYRPDTREDHQRSGAGFGDHPPVKHFFPAALRAPFEGRIWRELGYLLLSLPISVVLFSLSIALTSLGIGMLVTFLGVPILAGALAMCRGFGAMERARARGLLKLDVADPAPVRGRTGGLMSWVGAVLKSGVSWRHLLYALLHFPWAIFAFIVSLTLWSYGWAALTYPLWHWIFPTYVGVTGLQLYGDGTHDVYLDSPFDLAATSVCGLVVVLVTPWIIRGLATVDRVMVSELLGPSRLATRVSELESDRGVVVDTAAADLRRIERDLHDGAQARLVALAMDLGLAKEKLTDDPEAAARMVDEAHGEVKVALQELRDLARGIHPAVLTDRGLDAALSAIASRCTVPVTVEVDLASRPAQAIEGIAYFTVSELLQNVSKHAHATRASVDVWRTANRLMLQVTDNGRGGAEGSSGSGLAGLTERLDAVDGVLVVDSPQGGPTRITAELPWRG